MQLPTDWADLFQVYGVRHIAASLCGAQQLISLLDARAVPEERRPALSAALTQRLNLRQVGAGVYVAKDLLAPSALVKVFPGANVRSFNPERDYRQFTATAPPSEEIAAPRQAAHPISKTKSSAAPAYRSDRLQFMTMAQVMDGMADERIITASHHCTRERIWPQVPFAQLTKEGFSAQQIAAIEIVRQSFKNRPAAVYGRQDRWHSESMEAYRDAAAIMVSTRDDLFRRLDQGQPPEQAVLSVADSLVLIDEGLDGWRSRLRSSAYGANLRGEWLFTSTSGSVWDTGLGVAASPQPREIRLERVKAAIAASSLTVTETMLEETERQTHRRGRYPGAALTTFQPTARIGPERYDPKRPPSAADLARRFGLDGVEASLGHRLASHVHSVATIYDAMEDLADLIGIPAERLGLGGRLSILIDSELSATSASSYVPDKVQLRVSSSNPSAIARAWFQALDHAATGFCQSNDEAGVLSAGNQPAADAMASSAHALRGLVANSFLRVVETGSVQAPDGADPVEHFYRRAEVVLQNYVTAYRSAIEEIVSGLESELHPDGIALSQALQERYAQDVMKEGPASATDLNGVKAIVACAQSVEAAIAEATALPDMATHDVKSWETGLARIMLRYSLYGDIIRNEAETWTDSPDRKYTCRLARSGIASSAYYRFDPAEVNVRLTTLARAARDTQAALNSGDRTRQLAALSYPGSYRSTVLATPLSDMPASVKTAAVRALTDAGLMLKPSKLLSAVARCESHLPANERQYGKTSYVVSECFRAALATNLAARGQRCPALVGDDSQSPKADDFSGEVAAVFACDLARRLTESLVGPSNNTTLQSLDGGAITSVPDTILAATVLAQEVARILGTNTLARFRFSTGIEDQEAGSWDSRTHQATVQLNRERAIDVTRHECFHAAWDLMMTSADRTTVLRDLAPGRPLCLAVERVLASRDQNILAQARADTREMAAYAFQLHCAGELPQFDQSRTAALSVFDKIKAVVVDAVRNLFPASDEAQSATEVFESLYRGRYAARQLGTISPVSLPSAPAMG